VDDVLTSVSDVETGIKLVDGLRSMLAKAGFRLTEWLYNEERILAFLPEKELAKSVQTHSIDSSLQERVLGVERNVQSDEFRFTISLTMKPRTRRGLLSTMISLFDSLGLVAPVVLEARSIYRSLCEQELEWDEEMPEKDLHRWEKWLSSLPQLRNVSFPRCFNLNSYENMQKCQLHVFADASTTGCGAVCYLRAVDRNGNVTCTLAMSKARLVPKAETSVPRLELIAAVMAVQLEGRVKRELNSTFDPVYSGQTQLLFFKAYATNAIVFLRSFLDVWL